jgi:hypothetical protein
VLKCKRLRRQAESRRVVNERATFG